MFILGPIILYVFLTAEFSPAVVFAIWSILVGLSGGLMKPVLLGRGVGIPMLVILIGAMGRMITAGIIVLFIGSVVLGISLQTIFSVAS